MCYSEPRTAVPAPADVRRVFYAVRITRIIHATISHFGRRAWGTVRQRQMRGRRRRTIHLLWLDAEQQVASKV